MTQQKTAFLFPGQGSQSVGMMAGFAAADGVVRETFAEASGALGYDLWDVTQNGPDARLNQTEVTQPALLASSIATWRQWQTAGGADPDFLAGHSLGEYSALVAAGVIDFADAVRLVAERGRLMQAATPPGVGSMAAILGLENAALEAVCERAAQGQVVACANYNSPGQIVIAGHREAVERACEMAVEAGARRALPLVVSVPSHCALMRPAAAALDAVMAGLPFGAARIPVVHNVDVAIRAEADEIRAALSRQLWQPVRWSAIIERLVGEGVERFVECGPGKVLSGLNKRIAREVNSIALDSSQAVTAALGEVN
jgi:[acyl-carrier-protein] S-malonyltransferase